MVPVLGYWDLRGRANPHRLLLHYAGVAYQDKRYDMKNFGEEWMQKDKPILAGKLEFPNLPYYMDEDVQISQTHAILAYLGRKHGLDGVDLKERARIEMSIEQLREMFDGCIKAAYPPGNPFSGFQLDNIGEIHEKEMQVYISALPSKLAAISKFLGTGDWVCGNRLTYADFYFYDILDANRLLFNAKHLNAFPNLVEYMKRFEGLKGVKELMASKEYSRMPIFSPFALMGGTPDYKPTD